MGFFLLLRRLCVVINFHFISGIISTSNQWRCDQHRYASRCSFPSQWFFPTIFDIQLIYWHCIQNRIARLHAFGKKCVKSVLKEEGTSMWGWNEIHKRFTISEQFFIFLIKLSGNSLISVSFACVRGTAASKWHAQIDCCCCYRPSFPFMCSISHNNKNWIDYFSHKNAWLQHEAKKSQPTHNTASPVLFYSNLIDVMIYICAGFGRRKSLNGSLTRLNHNFMTDIHIFRMVRRKLAVFSLVKMRTRE